MRSSFSTIFLLYHVLSIWNFLILTCTIYILAPYLADPKSGPCPFFKKGDTFVLKRTNEQDDFYHLMNGKFCGEAWDAISRYVYTALQGGSIMRNWTNDDRMMIACCNDGTRPVIFKIERIDIPETEEEKEWLEKQNFKNDASDAYTG